VVREERRRRTARSWSGAGGGRAAAREERLAEAFRQAGSDPAFLEDVEETMRDFRDADAEQEGAW